MTQNFLENMESRFSRQLIYTCLAYLNAFLIGISRGFTNFMDKHLESSDLIGKDDIPNIASICVLLNPIGSLLAGVLMDQFGRVMTMKLAALLFSFGWLVIANSMDKFYLYAAYVVVGISVGMALTCTVYVAEICSDRCRCTMLSLFIVFYSWGVMVAYLVTYFLHWSLAAWAFMSISGVICLLLFPLPETPHWFIRQGKKEEAVRAFELARQITRADAEKEYEKSEENVEHYAEDKTIIKHIVHSWKQLGIAMVFQILVQCSGFTLLLVYSSSLFKGIMVKDSDEVVLAYSFAILISSFFCPFAALFGSRKKLVSVSAFFIAATSLVMLFSVRYNLPWIIQGSSYVYVFFNIVGTVNVVESLPSEIFRLQVRGVMCGILQAYSTVLQGTLIYIFPGYFKATNVSVVLLTFTAFSIALIFFGIFILPETKGKTLEQIQEEYFDKKSTESKLEKNASVRF